MSGFGEQRIARRFASLRQQGRSGLVTFITGGDPDLGTSMDILRRLPAAGADLIELGMPFSDPMADGPAIQASSQRASARRPDAAPDAWGWSPPSARPTAKRRSC